MVSRYSVCWGVRVEYVFLSLSDFPLTVRVFGVGANGGCAFF